MAAFTYNGIITLGSYQYTLDAKATITCTKKNSTTITLSIDKSQSTSYNHIYFPNGATNISLYVGIATSSSGTYTYKQVYYGWDPLPGSTSRQFTSSQSWDYTVSSSDTEKTLYIKFKVVDEGNGSNTILTPPTPSSTFYFSAGTTACGAPTSFTVNITQVNNKLITKPGNTLTFSWSGATAGTNNTISGYRIYWKQSSWPTTSSYDGYKDFNSSASSGTINGTECTLIGANASRGARIGFCIVTRGNAGTSYWSDTKKCQGADGYGILINRLPSAPTVSASSVTIKSTDSTGTITVTAGTDGDGQSYTKYYSTTAGGTKTLFTGSSWSPGTYYFWTYDGLEYSSSYTQATVTKNTKPTITLYHDTTAATTYTALNDSYTYTSRIPITITPVQSGKTGTLSYTWKYCTASSYTGTYSSWTTLKTGSASSISSTNPKTWTFNFASQLGDSYDGSKYYKWQVDFVFNDGIENSDTVPSNVYYYSPAPNKKAVTAYNTFSDENASGTTAAVICQKYRVRCYRDTSWSSTVVSVYDNTAKKSIGVEVSNTRGTTYHWVDISLNSLPANGNSITIKVQFLCSSSTITKDVCNNTVTEYNNPVITYAPTTAWTTYNVYTTSGNLDTSYSVTGTIGSAADYSWFAQYGNYIQETPFAAWSSTGANITASISAVNAFNFSGALSNAFSKYAGKYTVKTGISYTNVFGQKIYSNTKNIEYNFDTAPTFSGDLSYYYTTSTATNAIPGTSIGNRYIQEDLPFRVHGVVDCYSNRDVKVTVLQDAVEFGSKVISVNSNNNRSGASASFDITDVVQAIASSTNNKTWFTVKAALVDVPSLSTVTSASFSSIYIAKPMRGYNALTFENDTFTATVSVDSQAAVPTTPISSQTVQIAVINASTDTTKKQLSEWVTIDSPNVSSVSLGINSAYSDWNTQTGYLQTITTVVSTNSTTGGTGFTTRKYVISQNSYAVSKDNPTVSYRPNFVGINCAANMTAPEGEIVRLNAISGKNKISIYNEANTSHLDVTPASILLPSDGKIYINNQDMLLDILYPIGSTICVNTNTNPGSRLGGTWTLTDKQFINLHSSATSSYFTATSAIKNPAIRLYRAGHSLSIRLQFATNTTISTSSSGTKLGEFDLSALGILTGNLPTPRPLFWGGGTEQSLLSIVNVSGELMGYNVVPSGTLSTNTTLLAFWTLVAPPYMTTDSESYMLDSACDKFYFTRTA